MDKIVELTSAHNVQFKVVVLSPHEEVLEAMKARHHEGRFSLDIALPLALRINPSDYSACQAAIREKNSYATIGRPVLDLSPWKTYRAIVSHDICIRDAHIGG